MDSDCLTSVEKAPRNYRNDMTPWSQDDQNSLPSWFFPSESPHLQHLLSILIPAELSNMKLLVTYTISIYNIYFLLLNRFA